MGKGFIYDVVNCKQRSSNNNSMPVKNKSLIERMGKRRMSFRHTQLPSTWLTSHVPIKAYFSYHLFWLNLSTVLFISFYFPWVHIYLEMELMNHMVTPCLIFWKNARLFVIKLYRFMKGSERTSIYRKNRNCQ